MACPQLQLTSEIFGLPIEIPMLGKLPVRGQWVGFGPLTDGVEAPCDVTGVTVRVTESSTAGTIAFAVTVGAGDKVLRLPWDGTAFRLQAARFPMADFVVVRYVTGPTGGNYRWWHVVFDVRSSAATSIAPNPVVFGPEDRSSGVSDMNFCPDSSGGFVLLWSGYPANATGRVAAVYRTDRDAPSRSDALVGVDSASATGVIACRVDTTPAPGMLSIYDNALRQPGGVSLPNPPGTPIVSQSAPRPGRLRLSPRALALAATQGTAPFTISNEGEDWLEVKSVTVTGTPISVAPNVQLPVCLKPGNSLSVSVGRVPGTVNAATATITVSTAPAAAAGSDTVAVTLDKLVPDPRATVTPLAHTWKTGQTDSRPIVVKNTGNVPLVIGYSHPSHFTVTDAQTMNPPAQTTVAPGDSRVLRVAPPATCAGPQVADQFNIGAVLSPVTTSMPPMITGFPVAVQLTACVPLVVKVPPHALRITTIEGDAPGDDVLPEGEFIELLNTTSGPLDLTGCTVQDRLVSAAGVPGAFRKFFEFGPAVFGADSKLPPGQVLRLLTRAKAPSDGVRPFVVYAGLKQAVWNNSGDTGRILDENNILVDEYTYVTTPPAPGVPLPPGTVVSQRRAGAAPLVRRVYVDATMYWTDVFEVQDGDLVIINATGSARFGLFGGQIGPDGATGPLTPAGQGWPLENAPPFALIGSLEGGPPFLVGSKASITFNLNSRPLMLTLGPNDGELWDNAGEFDCEVLRYRS